MRRLWSQIIQTSGARVYALMIGLISMTITARYLGPSSRRVFAAAITWVTTYCFVAYLSMSQVVLYLATGKKKEEWLPAITGTLLVTIAMLTLLGWGVAAAMYGLSNAFGNIGGIYLIMAFAALPFMLWIENGNSILMALGRLGIYNVLQVIGATVSVATVVLALAVLHFGVAGALFAFLLFQVLVAVGGLIFVGRQTERLSFDFRILRQLLSGGLKLHLNAVGNILVLQAGVLFLNVYRSAAETGNYQLAAQLITAVQTLLIAANMVVYTVITRIGPDAAWPQQRKILLQSVALVCVGAVVLYFAAPPLITLLVGPKFLPAIPIFRILLLTTPAMTFSIVMAGQWIARGLFLQVSLVSTVIGLWSLAANWFGIKRYGMTGAAWASVATYAAGFGINVAMAVYAERHWRAAAMTLIKDTATAEVEQGSAA